MFFNEFYCVITGRERRIWLESRDSIDNNRIFLLVLYTFPSSRWCTYPIFWHEDCFWWIASGYRHLQSAYTDRSWFSLWCDHRLAQYTGDRQCESNSLLLLLNFFPLYIYLMWNHYFYLWLNSFWSVVISLLLGKICDKKNCNAVFNRFLW